MRVPVRGAAGRGRSARPRRSTCSRSRSPKPRPTNSGSPTSAGCRKPRRASGNVPMPKDWPQGVRGADEVAGRGRAEPGDWRSRSSSATRPRSPRCARCSATRRPTPRRGSRRMTALVDARDAETRAAPPSGARRQGPARPPRSAGWPRSTTRRPPRAILAEYGNLTSDGEARRGRARSRPGRLREGTHERRRREEGPRDRHPRRDRPRSSAASRTRRSTSRSPSSGASSANRPRSARSSSPSGRASSPRPTAPRRT